MKTTKATINTEKSKYIDVFFFVQNFFTSKLKTAHYTFPKSTSKSWLNKHTILAIINITKNWQYLRRKLLNMLIH